MLKYVLLGLIHLHPSISGYELKSIIDESTRFFFNASLSQIYPTLKMLNKEGLVTFRVEPLLGKQDRKVYTITDQGLQTLQEWLETPLTFEWSLNNYQAFLLRLTFCGILDKDHLLAYLNFGMQYYEKDAAFLSQQRLAVEQGYLDKTQPDYPKSLFLWNHELDYLIREMNLRTESIRSMIEALEREAAWECGAAGNAALDAPKNNSELK